MAMSDGDASTGIATSDGGASAGMITSDGDARSAGMAISGGGGMKFGILRLVGIGGSRPKGGRSSFGACALVMAGAVKSINIKTTVTKTKRGI